MKNKQTLKNNETPNLTILGLDQSMDYIRITGYLGSDVSYIEIVEEMLTSRFCSYVHCDDIPANSYFDVKVINTVMGNEVTISTTPINT